MARLRAAGVLLLSLAACSRGPRNNTQRVAVLGIDNLTGDASLDWISVAAPRIIASELTSVGGATAVVAASPSDAYAAGATRLVQGYFDRRDTGASPQGSAASLHFEVAVEDAASHHIQPPIVLDGPPLKAIDALAHGIDPAAHPFSSANAQAIEAFGKRDFARAVELDPDFSTAWREWAESLAAMHPEQASEILRRGLAQTGLRSPSDRSRMELLAASLTHDAAAELKALEAMAAQAPPDPNSLRGLAETAMNAREFATAVKYYRKLLELVPNDAAAENLMGYAYAFGGDLPSAMKSFAIYRRAPGQEANALDSMGEAYFVNGQFRDAEQFFLQAHDKDPSMLAGGDLLKAAYARFLSGDLAGADGIFKRFDEFRAQAKDPLLAWKRATWLYATGRSEQARAALESALPQASPQLAELARRQLAVWKVTATKGDLAVLRRAYLASTPSNDGLSRTFYAAALMEGGQMEEARKLLKTWPLPDAAGDPTLVSLVYPKFLELRQKVK